MYSKISTSFRQHRYRGFNLVEAAIVLGVIGLVIGGIWIAASTVYENMKVAHLITTVTQINNNAQKVLSASMVLDNAYTTIPSQLRYEIIPKDTAGPSIDAVGGGWGYTSNIHNGYNGSYGVSIVSRADGATYYNAPNGAILINVTNLPRAACINFITRITASAKNELINVGNAFGVNRTNAFPVPVDTPICQQSRNHLYLMFKFERIN